MSSARKKRNTHLSTNEIIDVINDLASDDEVTAADIYIDPPGHGIVSDSDSGDETNVTFENFSRRQLLAPAELTLRGINISDGSESDEEVSLPSTSSQSQSLATRKLSRPSRSTDNPPLLPPPPPPLPKTARKWVKKDLPQHNDEWIE